MAERTDDAKRVLEQMVAESKNEYVSAYDMAMVLASIDDRDSAFVQIERAYETREPWLVRLDVDPAFDRLRDDARFQDLRARVGL